MSNITQSAVKALFDYCPLTGQVTNKTSRSNRVKAGFTAGSVNSRGYRIVGINGKKYPVHVVIWLWMTGVMPTVDVDHKDRDRSNNKWGNLRLASRSQNLINQGMKPNNASGYKGVTSRGDSHSVKLRISGKAAYFGSYKTAVEAAQVYDKLAIQHYGEFAVTNRSLGLIP